MATEIQQKPVLIYFASVCVTRQKTKARCNGQVISTHNFNGPPPYPCLNIWLLIGWKWSFQIAGQVDRESSWFGAPLISILVNFTSEHIKPSSAVIDSPPLAVLFSFRSFTSLGVRHGIIQLGNKKCRDRTQFYFLISIENQGIFLKIRDEIQLKKKRWAIRDASLLDSSRTDMGGALTVPKILAWADS